MLFVLTVSLAQIGCENFFVGEMHVQITLFFWVLVDLMEHELDEFSYGLLVDTTPVLVSALEVHFTQVEPGGVGTESLQELSDEAQLDATVLVVVKVACVRLEFGRAENVRV